MITDEGYDLLMASILQDGALPTSFFVGMCNQTPARTDTLLSISTEPALTNGYARIEVPRNPVDWPVTGTLNALRRYATKNLIFTAAGGDFSLGFSRLFLATTVDNAGVLIAYSGKLTQPLLVKDGETKTVIFDFTA